LTRAERSFPRVPAQGPSSGTFLRPAGLMKPDRSLLPPVVPGQVRSHPPAGPPRLPPRLAHRQELPVPPLRQLRLRPPVRLSRPRQPLRPRQERQPVRHRRQQRPRRPRPARPGPTAGLRRWALPIWPARTVSRLALRTMAGLRRTDQAGRPVLTAGLLRPVSPPGHSPGSWKRCPRPSGQEQCRKQGYRNPSGSP
jgi:hypothetical protein